VAEVLVATELWWRGGLDAALQSCACVNYSSRLNPVQSVRPSPQNPARCAPNARQMMRRQRTFLADKDIRGRIYISPQGINCQAGGSTADAHAYVDWIAAQPEFQVGGGGFFDWVCIGCALGVWSCRLIAQRMQQPRAHMARCTCHPPNPTNHTTLTNHPHPPTHPQGVYYTLWPAPGHVHPKLRLKEKPALISLAGGVDGLSVTDPSARATPLEPSAWREMLRKADAVNSRVVAGQEDEVGDKVQYGFVVRCLVWGRIGGEALGGACSAIAMPSCSPAAHTLHTQALDSPCIHHTPTNHPSNSMSTPAVQEDRGAGCAQRLRVGRRALSGDCLAACCLVRVGVSGALHTAKLLSAAPLTPHPAPPSIHPQPEPLTSIHTQPQPSPPTQINQPTTAVGGPPPGGGVQ